LRVKSSLKRGVIILAGGKSLRLGEEKALINFSGKPLITYVVNTALKIANKVVVVVKDDDAFYKSFLPKNVIIMKDAIELQSPLIGMLTGMKILKVDYGAVFPCDCPFINENLINYLFKSANGFDAVVPKWPNGYIEPLHSIYKIKSAIPSIEYALKKGELSISSAINHLKKVAYIPINKLKKYDPKLLSFLNINTLEDFKAAEELLNPISC
jgi:molybdopterin-guanine dinucleotide biosynthesis protein A